MSSATDRKKTILFMVQLPPPVHGAALRNKSLLDSGRINESFTLIPLPLRFIDDMKNLGKFSVKKILIAIVYAFRLFSLLFTKKIDLVYFTMSPSGGAFYRDIFFIFIIKLFRKKRLLHFRVKGIQKTAASSIGKILIRYAFKGSDIVCLSKNHTLDIGEYASREIIIVPNGIKIEKDIAESISSSALAPGHIPRILFLSNLSRKKGIPELLEALSIVKQNGQPFLASLVGGEWDMSYSDVKDLIQRHGLELQVTIEGPKFGQEKFRYLRESDLFIFPTYFELFPGVILEAMQFGKAIISTKEGSIPEIIDDGINGILVQQQEVLPLADAACLLLKDPVKREEMGRLAKEKFFSEFTLSAFENKMNEVFHQVINKR